MFYIYRITNLVNGKTKSDAWKKKMSDKMTGNKNAKGCVRSEETRKKLSEQKKGNSWNKGKKQPEDLKQKWRRLMKKKLDLFRSCKENGTFNGTWNDFQKAFKANGGNI